MNDLIDEVKKKTEEKNGIERNKDIIKQIKDPGFVSKPYIAVIKPTAPVTFNAMAGMGAPVPAQIIINLGIAEPGGQVEALQALMNIFMDADAAADVLGQTAPQGMVDAIRRHF